MVEWVILITGLGKLTSLGFVCLIRGNAQITFHVQFRDQFSFHHNILVLLTLTFSSTLFTFFSSLLRSSKEQHSTL